LKGEKMKGQLEMFKTGYFGKEKRGAAFMVKVAKRGRALERARLLKRKGAKKND